jgi:hypothetical protein
VRQQLDVLDIEVAQVDHQVVRHGLAPALDCTKRIFSETDRGFARPDEILSPNVDFAPEISRCRV